MATRGRNRQAGSTRGAAQTLDLDIEEVSPEGEGIARAGHQTVLVPFTIPGERVQALVPRCTRPVVVARLVGVLTPSPHRVSPRCRHFGPAAPTGAPPCGGCTWQHIAYAEQLRLKTALVDRLVRARVPSAPRPGDTRTACLDNPWGFRQKAHFVFGEAAGRGRARSLIMGHFARGSQTVVEARECPVHDRRANAIAFDLQRELTRAGIRPAGARRGAIRSVAVRAALATGEVMTTIVVATDDDRQLRTATRNLIATAPAAASFHLNVHGRDDSFIFGARTRTLAGSDRLRDDLLGTSYLISPTSFFQTNSAAAEVLVSRVLDALPPPPKRVLDLYAGAGLFAIPLALAGHTVVAVESSRHAVADGIASARLNRLTEDRCRFLRSRTEDLLAGAPKADAVVLDPPREGCSEDVLYRLFGHLRPAVAAYVSCNPVALADDLAHIVALGYRIRSLEPVDMFPHTAHIETVAVLTR